MNISPIGDFRILREIIAYKSSYWLLLWFMVREINAGIVQNLSWIWMLFDIKFGTDSRYSGYLNACCLISSLIISFKYLTLKKLQNEWETCFQQLACFTCFSYQVFGSFKQRIEIKYRRYSNLFQLGTFNVITWQSSREDMTGIIYMMIMKRMLNRII